MNDLCDYRRTESENARMRHTIFYSFRVRFAYLLAAFVIILALAACGSSDEGSSDSPSSSGGTTTVSVTASAATVAAFNPAYRDVISHDGVYYAVGAGGVISTSDDGGATWIDQDSGTINTLTRVAANGTTIVAVGSGGYVRSTDSGANWSSGDLCSPFSTPRALLYADNKFVAHDGSNFCTSTTGSSWSTVTQNLPLSSAENIAYDGTNYLAVGLFFVSSSSDLAIWIESPTSAAGTLRDVVYDDTAGQYLVIGDRIAFTVDPATLPFFAVLNDVGTPPASCCNFVAVTTSGVYYGVSSGGPGSTSPDGDVWSDYAVREATNQDRITDVAAESSTSQVVVGEGSVIYSGDGTIWTLENSGNGTDGILAAFAYDGTGEYMAFSSDRSDVPGRADTATSSDGATWTMTAGKTGLSSPRAIAYGNGSYVTLGGSAEVSTTIDSGASWTRVSARAEFSGIYADGSRSVYYLAASFGRVGTSTDDLATIALTEPLSSLLGFSSINGIASDGNTTTETIVAVGSSGQIITSSDGATWSAATSSAALGTANINKLTYDATHDTFIAILSNNLIASSDGDTWAVDSSGFTATAFGVSPASGGIVLAGGANSVIYQSTDGLNFTFLSTQPANGLTTTGTVRQIAYGADAWLLTDSLTGVFESTNNGLTWVNINLGTDTVGSNPLFLVGNGGTEFYVATPSGVAKLTRTGAATYTFANVTDPDTGGNLFLSNMYYDATTSSFVGSSQVKVVLIAANGNVTTAFNSQPVSVGVAYNGGQFASVGGVIATSADGLAWTLRQMPNNGLITTGTIVPSGDSGFLAAGADTSGTRAMFSSSDGVIWDEIDISSTITKTISYLATNGSVYLAAYAGAATSGEKPRMYTSSDGTTWSEIATADLGSNVTGVSSSWLTDYEFRGLTWDGQRFFALATKGSTGTALLLESTDGSAWNAYDTGLTPEVTALFSDGSTVLIGGAHGLVGTHSATTFP